MKRRLQKRKNKSRSNRAQLKKRVKHALQGLYAISMAFMVLLLVSLAFLLYQWKDYKITEYAKQIQLINSHILKLQSENSRYRSKINSELLKYSRIAKISQEKLNLQPSVQKPIVLKVDKNKLKYYAEKNREEKE